MTDLFKCDSCDAVQSGARFSFYVYNTNAEGKRVVRNADLDLTCFEAIRVQMGEGQFTRIKWIEKIVERRKQ